MTNQNTGPENHNDMNKSGQHGNQQQHSGQNTPHNPNKNMGKGQDGSC